MQLTLKPDEARYLAAAALFASTDDAAPVITGVQLLADESGLRVISTDRYAVFHALLADVDITAPDETPALIPAKPLAAAVKALLRSKVPILLTIEDGRWTVTDYTQTFQGLLLAGNYPPVTRLFPESAGPIRVAKWNARYLALLEKAATALGADRHGKVWALAESAGPNETKPRLLAFHGDATVLLMSNLWTPGTSVASAPDGTVRGSGLNITLSS